MERYWVSSKKIIITDDHPLFRKALTIVVEKAIPNAEISYASSLQESLRMTEELNPDLVLLDLQMSDAKGLESILEFQTHFPNVKKLVVSANDDPKTIRFAKQAGMFAYLKKSTELSEMIYALSHIIKGRKYWSQSEYYDKDEAIIKRLISLTPAQFSVLKGINQGLLNKQIAYQMNIKESTVKAHITVVFRKLGVVNRTQALLVSRFIFSEE